MASISPIDHRLSVRVGDRVQIIKRHNNGWMYGKISTYANGCAPKKTEIGWFHTNVFGVGSIFDEIPDFTDPIRELEGGIREVEGIVEEMDDISFARECVQKNAQIVCSIDNFFEFIRVNLTPMKEVLDSCRERGAPIFKELAVLLGCKCTPSQVSAHQFDIAPGSGSLGITIKNKDDSGAYSLDDAIDACSDDEKFKKMCLDYDEVRINLLEITRVQKVLLEISEANCII